MLWLKKRDVLLALGVHMECDFFFLGDRSLRLFRLLGDRLLIAFRPLIDINLFGRNEVLRVGEGLDMYVFPFNFFFRFALRNVKKLKTFTSIHGINDHISYIHKKNPVFFCFD